MVAFALILAQVFAVAVLAFAVLALYERVARLEEREEEISCEPCDRHPDSLFREWMYGGDA